MTSIGTTLLVLVMLWLVAIWIAGFYRHTGIAQPHQNNLLIYTLIIFVSLLHPLSHSIY